MPQIVSENFEQLKVEKRSFEYTLKHNLFDDNVSILVSFIPNIDSMDEYRVDSEYSVFFVTIFFSKKKPDMHTSVHPILKNKSIPDRFSVRRDEFRQKENPPHEKVNKEKSHSFLF